jgi:hypothetical protein
MIILVGIYLCANGENELVLIFLDSIDGKRNFLLFFGFDTTDDYRIINLRVPFPCGFNH